MRISDLSRACGVPVPTIKYYLREGLLAQGELTSANQAVYGEAHVRRLRLVRVLVEVGGLSIAGVRAVLAALADETLGIHDLLGTVQNALAKTEPKDDPAWRAALAEVNAYLEQLGWRICADAAGRYQLADVLHALRTVYGPGVPVSCFDPYAQVAAEMGRQEVASLPGPDAPREELITGVTVGIAIYEAALTALRQLAQEHASAERYGVQA